MKKFFSEFKEFISKGNVMDMAVAVVIGAAFGKIVTSLVNDIIMPLVSLITGGISVSDWKWVITAADEANGVAENALNYGMFIQNVIDFLIVSFVIFVVLKAFLAAKNLVVKKEEVEKVKEEKAPEETELDVLKEIRDALAENKNDRA